MGGNNNNISFHAFSPRDLIVPLPSRELFYSSGSLHFRLSRRVFFYYCGSLHLISLFLPARRNLEDRGEICF